MPRETKKFTTTSGHSIEVKTYLTGREANAVKEDLYKEMRVDIAKAEEGKALSSELSGSFILDQEKKLLGIIVVSINGNTESILENILDMRNEDYQDIVREVNGIYRGNLVEAK